ncbi:MAG TPA: TorF family putative porin [Sphingomicrobium sp.]
MTAHAAIIGSRTRGLRASLHLGLLFVTAGLAATPAPAEVGAAASLFSDARFRGFSISNGDPVAILDLSYDDPDGLYAAASGSIVARRGTSLHPLQLQLYGGYARRLSPGLTLDLGAGQSIYSHYASVGPARSYTELYAGVSGKSLSSRISVSPDYFRSGSWSVYGEVNGNIRAPAKLRVEGHVGLLASLHNRRVSYYSQPELDWRIGVSRTFGRVSLHAALTGRGAGNGFYEDRGYGHRGVVVGLTYAL